VLHHNWRGTAATRPSPNARVRPFHPLPPFALTAGLHRGLPAKFRAASRKLHPVRERTERREGAGNECGQRLSQVRLAEPRSAIGARLYEPSDPTVPRVRYFYRLRWSAATYKRGQLRPVGLDTAEALFPQVRARKTAAAGSALKEAMRPINRYGYRWLWHARWVRLGSVMTQCRCSSTMCKAWVHGVRARIRTLSYWRKLPRGCGASISLAGTAGKILLA
jgi:hypothetical protein